MNRLTRAAHKRMVPRETPIDYPALRLCHQDSHAWIVVPEITPEGWDVRDNRGSWARSELHLYRSPHSSNTPLNPRIIGTLPALPGRDDAGTGATAARLADVPVCPGCFFHLYPLEIFTMASIFTARGQARWNIPWRKSHVHLVDGAITHGGQEPWDGELLWHVYTHFKETNPRTGAFVKTEMGGTGDILTVEELIAHNEGQVCADCLFRLFPEYAPPLDPRQIQVVRS